MQNFLLNKMTGDKLSDIEIKIINSAVKFSDDVEVNISSSGVNTILNHPNWAIDSLYVYYSKKGKDSQIKIVALNPMKTDFPEKYKKYLARVIPEIKDKIEMDIGE
jgi:hypothetical protein